MEQQILLDVLEYDYLFLGTGLIDSLLAACLSKAKKKILVLDIDKSYSSSLQTVNLKEFLAFLNPQNVDDSSQCLKKNNIFKKFWYDKKLFSEEDFQKNMNLYEYKSFNIDLQPKLLFSTSLSVDLMKEADMDKYMEFRAIHSIFHYDNQNNKFLLTPSSKGQIFIHKDLNLFEKRTLFKTLQCFINIFHAKHDVKVDVNSTAEFDKAIEIDTEFLSNYEKFKNETCVNFLEALGLQEKIKNILLYTLANIEYNVEISKKVVTTEELFTRMFKFIKSLGVHSSLPYLYTIYGTGDIPQAYARIAAVYGATYIINESLKIEKVQKNEEKFEIFCNIAGENKFFTCKQIVVGMEYQKTLPKIFEEKLREIMPQQIKEDFNYLLRMVLVFKGEFLVEKEENNEIIEENIKKLPLIYVIPPKNGLLKNLHPITCIFFGNNTYSAPKGKFLVCVKTALEDKNVDFEEFSKNLHQFILKEIKTEENQWELTFSSGYIQEKNEGFPEENLNHGVFFIKNNDFDIDLDKYFQEFIDKISIIVPELFKNKKDNFFVSEMPLGENSDELEGKDHEINKILQNLDKIILSQKEKKPEEEEEKNEN